MGVDDFVRGELKLGLMFQPHPTATPTPSSDAAGRGTLNILVKEARDLPAMNSSGLADTVVKCFLLPDHSSVSKRKTGVVKNNLNPVWEEKFGYEGVSLRELLSERVLELTLWHRDKHGNEFVGGMRMGGAPGRSPHQQKWMDAIGAEVSHWEDMLSQPGKWIEEWHTLRPSMVPREVDLSKTPPPFTLPSLETPPPQSRTGIQSNTKPSSSISPETKDGTDLRTTEEPLPSSLPGDAVAAEGAGVSVAPSAVPDIQLEADVPPSLSQPPPPPTLTTQQADVPPTPSQPPPPAILATQQPDINGHDWQDPFEDEPKSKPRVSHCEQSIPIVYEGRGGLGYTEILSCF